jgi:predicted RNase H-like HicB family nuclease
MAEYEKKVRQNGYYLPFLGGDMATYTVNMAWDDEAYVWLATSEDVPGLVLEGGSLDALMERVKYAVPDLLNVKDARIDFKAERVTEVHT